MQFDAEEHKDSSFEALPKGNYIVMVDKAETKWMKSNKGEQLVLELIVHDGPYRGRRLWDRFIISHSESEDAVRIGLGKLSTCSRSLGMPKWRHERELVGRAGEVVVGFDKSDETRNEIKGWVVRDRAAQQAPTSNPAKSQHYAPPGYGQQQPIGHGGPTPHVPTHYGPPTSAPRPGAPGAPSQRVPGSGYPSAPQGYPTAPSAARGPSMGPPAPTYPEMPRRGMSETSPPESYEPPPFDDGVPF